MHPHRTFPAPSPTRLEAMRSFTLRSPLRSPVPRPPSRARSHSASGTLRSAADRPRRGRRHRRGTAHRHHRPGPGRGHPLSQGRPVTASSVENAAYPAGLAVDGNGGTRWSSAAADNQWIRVDLGANSAINRVVLNWEAAYASTYQLQVSADGTNWVTVRNAMRRRRGSRPWTSRPPAGTYGCSPPRGPPPGASRSGSSRSSARPATQAVPPGAVRVAEFLAECPYSHRLPDDPIVLPGLPGGSHMHSFFGNNATDAFSDLGRLETSGGTCNPVTDISSYWVPTLYADNVPVEPTGTTFYYLGEGVRDDVIANTQPLPRGLRIVAGNAKATGPDDNTISRWSCLHAA